jgi:4-amino-4-deoxy-L-arabinose transferase-like glycosyltransferase
LPVALLSTLFLCFFFWRLSAEWDRRTAAIATAMLATSAGWLAYSHVAVTDLPMAAFFSASVLLSLQWIARRDTDPGTNLTLAAACLGIATLAKGLVPLVLFLPVLAVPLFKGQWRSLGAWFRPWPILAFCICSLPWYILCTARNGAEFLRVFFLEQHFGRFRTAALQHVQPPWFYVPILLVLLYPWFPLLAFRSVLSPAGIWRDSRVQTLAAIVLFGFVFFSISVNKLPGYLIPLIPSVFTLLGLGLARAKRPAIALIAPLILLGALPLIGELVPAALAPHGLRSLTIPWVRVFLWLTAAAAAGVALARFSPKQAFGAVATLAAAGFLWFQFVAFPQFDLLASARPLWAATHPPCALQSSRDILYGLYYYSQGRISSCVVDPGAIRVVR